MEKRSFLAMLFVLLIVGTAPGDAIAGDQDGRFGLGLRAGYIRFVENSYDAADWIIDMDPSPVIGIHGIWRAAGRLTLELGVDHFQDADGDVFGPVVLKDPNATNVESYAVMLTAQYRLPSWWRIAPYIGGGINYNFNGIDKEPPLSPTVTEMTLDDSIGWHLNAGTDITITGRLALNLDVRYLQTRTELNFTEAATGVHHADDYRLDRFAAAVGLRYYFGR